LYRLRVRPAQLSDADAMFHLLRGFAMSHEPVRSAFNGSYPRILENVRADLLVAEQGGAVAGYVLASDSLTLFANGVVTELMELFVEEEPRGRGTGRELVGQAVVGARDRGAIEITAPTTRARSFYLSLGFQFTAEFFKLDLQT
jgi:N-acetylglutamate synthase-like GNAT family acetyltransferase